MTSPDEHPLDQLPNVLEECATSVPSVNQSLFKASFLRANDHQDVMERYILKSCKFGWKFYITKRETGGMLFLLKKRDTGDFIVMKTAINFKMSPTEYQSYQNNVIPRPQFNWTPPSFIISDQNKIKEEAEKLNRSAKKFKVDVKDCILLDVGIRKKKLLLIAFPKGKEKKASFYYTKTSTGEGKFTKNMLFDFCGALKEGLQNEFEGGKPLQLGLNEDNEVQKIIRQIYEGYKLMVSQVATNDETWLQHGIIHYKVKDFIADVTLRLKEDGALAWKYAEDDPFQMQLHLSVQHQEGQPMVQLKTFPPDFLTGGALYQKLMDAVYDDDKKESTTKENEDILALENEEKLNDEERKELEEEVKEEQNRKRPTTPFEVIKEKFGSANWPEDIVQKIFDQCREEGAVIFRIKRKKTYDTNLFVLIGKVGTSRHALVFEGKFEVRFKEGEPEVRLLRKSSLKVLYNSSYQPINGGERVEKYFKKLIWFLKLWVDLID